MHSYISLFQNIGYNIKISNLIYSYIESLEFFLLQFFQDMGYGKDIGFFILDFLRGNRNLTLPLTLQQRITEEIHPSKVCKGDIVLLNDVFPCRIESCLTTYSGRPKMLLQGRDIMTQNTHQEIKRSNQFCQVLVALDKQYQLIYFVENGDIILFDSKNSSLWSYSLDHFETSMRNQLEKIYRESSNTNNGNLDIIISSTIGCIVQIQVMGGIDKTAILKILSK